MTKDNPIHVLINNHVDARKHILLSGIGALKTLEKYEYFKKLKHAKKKRFLQLSEQLKSLKLQLDHLLNILPPLKEQRVERQVSRIEHKEEPISRVSRRVSGKRGAKDRELQHEIQALQDKLAKLEF